MALQVVFKREGLIGGATGVSGDVDGISATNRGDGEALQVGDVCTAVVSGIEYSYRYSDGTGATESSPELIKPDVGAVSDEGWVLQGKKFASDVTMVDGSTVYEGSGEGVNFGNETLAAYDEGTFTPAMLFSVSQGDLSYDERSGTYTLIGDQCFFRLYIRFDQTTADGDITITGLPFTSDSVYTPVNIISYRCGRSGYVEEAYTLMGTATIGWFLFPQSLGDNENMNTDYIGTSNAWIRISGNYKIA